MTEPLLDRIRRFKDSVGVLSWNGRHAGLHPDACVCSFKPDAFPGTPHTHNQEPPYACARCDCEAYSPRFTLDLVIPGFVR